MTVRGVCAAMAAAHWAGCCALLLLCATSSSLAATGKLVLIEDAVSEGAVCLDGTPPGYYYKPVQWTPPCDLLAGTS